MQWEKEFFFSAKKLLGTNFKKIKAFIASTKGVHKWFEILNPFAVVGFFKQFRIDVPKKETWLYFSAINILRTSKRMRTQNLKSIPILRGGGEMQFHDPSWLLPFCHEPFSSSRSFAIPGISTFNEEKLTFSKKCKYFICFCLHLRGPAINFN